MGRPDGASQTGNHTFTPDAVCMRCCSLPLQSFRDPVETLHKVAAAWHWPPWALSAGLRRTRHTEALAYQSGAESCHACAGYKAALVGTEISVEHMKCMEIISTQPGARNVKAAVFAAIANEGCGVQHAARWCQPRLLTNDCPTALRLYAPAAPHHNSHHSGQLGRSQSS